MTTYPVAPISAISGADKTEALLPIPPAPVAPHGNVSFSQMFYDGIDKVSQQATQADGLVKAFVLDDSIPPHRVMFALEQSRLSLQLMLQVRNRLVEGYQEIMRMQL